MEVKSEAKYIRMSPRKIRLAADLVRKMPLDSALIELSANTKRAAKPILKVLKSAIADAENNFKLKKENLYLKSIEVGQGMAFKRWHAVSRGMAHGYKKMTSHIKVVLAEKEKLAGKAAKVKKEEKPVREAKKTVKRKEKNGTKNKS